uniref:Uncharacterized protein n=1 Tax=Rousettus aegyptiacus TaxID=9407 RepID=A0A7J8ILT6_ROUAE|nr:hypothetical protein HJG63_010700 [Rousettus aegyptiacus]
MKGVPRAGWRGTDLDGAGVLAVVQQPHGAAVLALQAPAAAAHQPAQHLPARPPAAGRDAAALRTPDQAPLNPAAPRRPRAPAPSPQPRRRRCLLLAPLLLFSSSFSATASPSPEQAPRSLLGARRLVPSSWGGASAGGGPMGVSAAELSGRQ